MCLNQKTMSEVVHEDVRTMNDPMKNMHVERGLRLEATQKLILLCQKWTHSKECP
jgi:hypothetical protein